MSINMIRNALSFFFSPHQSQSADKVGPRSRRQSRLYLSATATSDSWPISPIGDVHWLENFNNPSDDRPEKYACPGVCHPRDTHSWWHIRPLADALSPSARYSCLLIGRTRLEPCRACASCFKKVKGSEGALWRTSKMIESTFIDLNDFR